MKIDWALFTFPFDDKRWQSKFAIGAGLVLVATYLALPFFWLFLPVAGYMLRIMRNSARGEPPSLPEWDNWGELFADGLRVALVGVVYLLPVIALFICVEATWFGMPFMMAGMARGAGGRALTSMIFGLYGLSFLGLGLIFLLSIPLGILASTALSRVAVYGSVGKGFEVGEVWALLKRGAKHYLIAYLVYFGVNLAVTMIAQTSMATIILCCIYPFLLAIGMFYVQTEMGALVGMAYYQTEHGGAAKVDAPAATLLDTGPLIKTGPLLKKPEGAVTSPAEKDEFSTDEVPVVKPSDVTPLADEIPAVKPEDVVKPAGVTPPADETVVAKPSNPTPAADATPLPDPTPLIEPPAPKKRRASTPRKKKSSGGEDKS